MKKLLPPYFVWSVVYLGVNAAFGTPTKQVVRALIVGASYVHLYFLFVLIQFELLRPLLVRAVRKWPGRTLILSAAVTFGLQVWVSLGALGICRTFRVLTVVPAGWFLSYIMFYVEGLWLAPRYAQLRERRGAGILTVSAGVWLLSAAAVLITAKYWTALRENSIRPDLTVYTMASVLCAVLFLPRVHLSWLRCVLSGISSLSFVLYLSHPLVLRLWREWEIRQNPPVFLKLSALYLLVAAGGLAIAWAIDQLPFGVWLGGRARHKTPT